MAEARPVTFQLRTGERRTYNDVTRVDDSRPHLVLVYSGPTLIAQLNKHDVLKFSFEESAQPSAPA
jgi:hypothetical protein